MRAQWSVNDHESRDIDRLERLIFVYNLYAMLEMLLRRLFAHVGEVPIDRHD